MATESTDGQLILSRAEVDLFVDEFVGSRGGYLGPWSYHKDIIRVLRKARFRESQWDSVRYQENESSGAAATMKRFLLGLPADRALAAMEAIRDHLNAGNEPAWKGPMYPGVPDELEEVLNRLRRNPVHLASPDGTWPDTSRKLNMARQAISRSDPLRAIELLYPALRSFVDKIMADHQPSIRKAASLRESMERIFSEHEAFKVHPDWEPTVAAFRRGLAEALEKAHFVRSHGTDVHERTPQRPMTPSVPIDEPEAYLMAELMVVAINYLHNVLSGRETTPSRSTLELT
jgi:hypothetical protein